MEIVEMCVCCLMMITHPIPNEFVTSQEVIQPPTTLGRSEIDCDCHITFE